MDAARSAPLEGRYKYVDDVKVEGAHFTPKILSDFVASKILKSFRRQKNNSVIRVLDPGIGDGELLLSLTGYLTQAGFSNVHVYGFETSEKSLTLAQTRLKQTCPRVPVFLANESFLEFALKNYPREKQMDLFNKTSSDGFDLIISNPPYVRTQIMGARESQKLSGKFGLSDRVDLYYAFLHGMAVALKPGGVVGVIVSNRFMSIKSGAAVRKMILEDFDILHVWDFGDTRLFNAAVLPAVLLLKKKNGRPETKSSLFTSIYSTTGHGSAKHTKNVIAALKEEGLVALPDGRRFLVEQGKLDHGNTPSDVWRLSTKKLDSWLATVKEHTWATFKEIGNIRVGVKTTADKVFIRSDWNDIPETERPELLRPLITHHGACRFKAIELDQPKQIIYPHFVKDGKRRVVDLKKYPRTAKYLKQHRAALEARKYLIEAGRNWFEIWVPQDPEAWEQEKIVFRDISEHPVFWMDTKGSVVNGDCYWLASHNPRRKDLLWLALAVGNSTFTESFYDRKFHNKLYAGRRRFITQYVEQFPLPDPNSSLGKTLIRLAKKIYSIIPSKKAESLEKQLDGLVWQAFGVSVEKITR